MILIPKGSKGRIRPGVKLVEVESLRCFEVEKLQLTHYEEGLCRIMKMTNGLVFEVDSPDFNFVFLDRN